MAPEPSPRLQHRDDATCLACGCLCDDIRVQVHASRIVGADRACPLGERWFLAERPAEAPACQVDGRPAELDDGLDRAASILARAKHPLIFGLAGATCEAQRAAAALADRLGACIDVGTSATATLTAAVQSVGMVTATLGEVRHRADFVMFWCVDPATTHPRHFERYSLDCAGEFIPRGRADRTCVVVDNRHTQTAEAADSFYKIRAGSEPAALDVLGALIAGEQDFDETRVVQQTGLALSAWRELVGRMQAARYAAIFFQPGGATETLLMLARDMNRHTRCVALPLGSPANAAGAAQVLTWQTGYPSGIDFAAGYPEFHLDKNSAEHRLRAGETDAALVVACEPLADPLAELSESARARLNSIPSVCLHTADWRPSVGPAVAVTVATPGIDASGTVFRCDGVALPLRPAVNSPYSSAENVLLAIEKRVRQLPAASRG